MTRLDLLAGLTVSALALSAGMAHAQATRTWDGSESSDWSDPDNWVGGVVPVAGDDIIIQDVTNQPDFDGSGAATSYNSLVLQASATMEIIGTEFVIDASASMLDNELAIAAGAHLDFTGTNPVLTLTEVNDGVSIAGSGARILTVPGSSDARIVVEAAATFNVSSGGRIELDGLTSNPPVFMVDANTTFTTSTGVGEFRMNAGSKIEIDADKVLTNVLSDGIIGQGTIDGNVGGLGQNNGKLVNNSSVEAAGGSTAVLLLTSTLLVEDTDPAGSEWIAADGATLSFLASLSNLKGDFELRPNPNGDGSFRFHDNVNVVTEGEFICDGDGVKIDNNASFTFDFNPMTMMGTTISSDCSCGTCPES